MIKVFKKIWNFSQEEQGYIRRSIIAGFFHAIFNALQFGAIYYMLIAIFSQRVSTQTIWICLGILLVSLVGKIATQKISQMNQTHAGYFMAAHKRIEIGEKIKKVPMGFFSSYSLGRLTTIATTSLSQAEQWIPMLLVLVLGGILNTLIFVLGTFIFNQKIGLVAVVGVIVFFIVTSLMEKKSTKNAKKMTETQTELTKQVLAAIQGMQVIKSYNLAGTNNRKLEKSIKDTSSLLLKLEKSVQPYIVTQRIVMGITTVAMTYLSIKLNLAGDLPLTETILMIIASFIIFEGLVGAGSNMAILRAAENAIDSVDFVNEIPDMKEGTERTPIQNHNIEFKDVSFSYDQRPILKNVSCAIKENTMTAIVGPSGSGKTTFCNLIARFWDVDSGQISIGGKNIKDYTIENLMNNISMVFQNVYLFEDTIENNIKFGKQDATKDEIIEAAKKAQCHDLIMTLPQGYQTMIGEGGASLSGGEKQRISIARAMLKDAPIIIFDEATANIDPENEDKLKEAIESLTKDKTVIMIAHRLKTIRNADQILVLNQGNIVERGDHETLMAYGGLYKDLIKAKKVSESWKLNN
ncbi:MAG: ABC transporter ATP-binding protein [Peptoniphilus harei]|uniref:ABC transporter ATP-binding protein n=1 Tax=Peptoniphilus harei TaxID=54005 RepID=UPI00254CBF32|nr:ABC transporter ATP-binding protein [Peptoniphilus harei]MDK7755737.1 ABC transporter ATP-binding protein [Peptoniphilus harei]MDK7761207.1 ABC transporter ATP-binding protein [Peptoniphilus harei]MDK8271497.1 ABC transporter ATP-binding protein [Peptoniphilus harei]MDK8339974.1 ABC transporter ATP-binding protein [Peptoniphilus harei]